MEYSHHGVLAHAKEVSTHRHASTPGVLYEPRGMREVESNKKKNHGTCNVLRQCRCIA
jgi:hypothetical protein